MSALAPHHPPRLSDRDFATQVEDTLQSCTEAKRVRWWVHYKKLAPLLDAKVASFSHDFAYEQDGTAAGDAGNFVVDWDDGSECQRDVPAADFRKNVRLSYYKHA